MNVSLHARAQLLGRMPAPEAVAIIMELEGMPVTNAEVSEARIIRRFGEQRSDGQSNGEVLLAIINGGRVVTCYWRRATQSFDADTFKVGIITDSTRTDAETAEFERMATEKAVARLRKAWDAR